MIAVKRSLMRGTVESTHRAGRWAGGQNYGAGMTGGDAEGGVDKRKVRAMRVRTCALNAEPLKAPLVADELGQIFNKMAVLEALSAKSMPDNLDHVRGLRDLIDLRLFSAGAESEKKDEYFTGESAAVTSCPVTGSALDGAKPFILLKTTGWVLSEAALNQVGAKNLQAEYGPFDVTDVIRLAPEDSDLPELKRALLAKRQIEDDDKKKRKQDKKKQHRSEEEPKKTKKAKKNKPIEEEKETRGPVVHVSEAARIASEAKGNVVRGNNTDRKLAAIFHESDDTKKTDPSKLFIATAPNRYYLN